MKSLVYGDGTKGGAPSLRLQWNNRKSKETRTEDRKDNKCSLLSPSIVWPLGYPGREQFYKSADVTKEWRWTRRKVKEVQECSFSKGGGVPSG